MKMTFWLPIVFGLNLFSAPAHSAVEPVFLYCGLIESINGEIAYEIQSDKVGVAKVLSPRNASAGTKDILLNLSDIYGRLPQNLKDPSLPQALGAAFIMQSLIVLQYDWSKLHNVSAGSQVHTRFIGFFGDDPAPEPLTCDVLSADEYDKIKAKF